MKGCVSCGRRLCDRNTTGFCHRCSAAEVARKRRAGYDVSPTLHYVLAFMRDGEWRKPQSLGWKHRAFWNCIERLRDLGYGFEADRPGRGSRGYRLIYTPQEVRAA